VPAGAAPAPYIQAVVATAETVTPRPGPLGGATAEEIGQILGWLAEPGARLIALDGEWASPAHGAGRLRYWLDAAEAGRAAARPFDDRRGLRPVHRPARAAM
jgi:DNA polymerase-3 subunit epsilon